MAKIQQDEEKVNVDEIAEGKDADVQTAAPQSPLATLLKSRVVKILGYSFVAILLIVVSVIISWLVVKNYTSSRLNIEDQRWEEKKPDPLSILTIGDFKLSTADVEEPHFARISISFGYGQKDMKLVTELNARKVQIIDLIYSICAKLKKEDIDEPEEREELKERIKDEVNRILQMGEIKAVYFTEFSIT